MGKGGGSTDLFNMPAVTVLRRGQAAELVAAVEDVVSYHEVEE